MIPRPLESISEQDLASLVVSGISEGRTLEFKRVLPGGKDDDMKEFLGDVTSLANAQGGDLLFGVEDKDGVAVALPGIDPPSLDDAILRLESLLRDLVEPRLPSAKFHWVPLSAGGVLVLRISASLAAPHRVKKNDKFYGRNSRGKYPMDTHEIRLAFTASEGVPARLRTMHDDAFAGILPVRLFDGPTAQLSVIPLTVLRDLRDVDPSPETALAPVKPSGSLEAFNTLEGVILHTPIDPAHMPESPRNFVRSFALTDRRGHAHVGWTIGGERELRRGMTSKLVFVAPFETDFLGIAISAMAKLQAYGLDGPWVVLLTIRGIEGFELLVHHEHYSKPAWRDGATLPAIIVDHIDEATLLPVIKSFWLLFGLVRPTARTPA